MAREKDNIDEFCKLVERINKMNDYLDEEATNYYDGGHSFEEIYVDEISKLNKMKSDLGRKMRHLSSPRRFK